VSAGFGFGGGGAGTACQQRAGQNKSGDEEDEETKAKCHWSHCHQGYPRKFSVLLFMVLCDFQPFLLSDVPFSSLHRPENKKGRNRKTNKSTLDAKI
jgi:hypothetical protein